MMKEALDEFWMVVEEDFDDCEEHRRKIWKATERLLIQGVIQGDEKMAETVVENVIDSLDDSLGGFEKNYETVLDAVKLLMKYGYTDKANEVLKALAEEQEIF